MALVGWLAPGCSPARPGAADGGGQDAAFAGCSKDTDCKGDRICVGGICMEPTAPDAATGGACPGGWMGLANRVDYATAGGPQAIAAGDLDGDGSPDVAVSTLSDGLNVLLNQGNGTLAAHVDYGVGKGTSVAIGDLNGDGRPDVAVSNGGGMANLLGGDVNSVAVFFNRGRGVLSASMDVATGVGPRAAAIGDMNGDHRPDLVAVNYTDQTVSVLVNQGGGTFAAHVDYPAGSMPWSLALGDVNGDGLPDVAVPDYGGAARVLLNRSGGALSAPLAYPVGTQPVAAAIGDLNGDAAPDLAVANSADDTVTVLLNHGGGTFAVGPSHGVGTHPNDVAIGDLDGDGNADLVVADQDFSSQSGITVLLNKGDGTFPTRMDFGSGPGPSSLALADFNGDRALDVAVVNSGGDTISVLLNKGCH